MIRQKVIDNYRDMVASLKTELKLAEAEVERLQNELVKYTQDFDMACERCQMRRPLKKDEETLSLQAENAKLNAEVERLQKALEVVCADLACDDACPDHEGADWVECKTCPGRLGEIHHNTERDIKCWMRYYREQAGKEGER